MFWLIQNNLWNELNFMNMVDCLVRQNIQHSIVKVIPFAQELANVDNEPDYDWKPPEGPVYVCGGTTLSKIAARKGWTPGAFINDNFDMKKHLNVWGHHMLNKNAIYTTFGELTKPSWPEFFIRPIHDDKTFAGHLTGWENFSIWRKKVVKLRDTYTSLDENTQIMVAEPQAIFKEFRFFIVDEKIATHSLYKLGERVVYRNDMLDDDLRSFVVDRITDARGHPARAYVMDVAETPEGFKIIEINCINSSGFYASDVMKLVESLELMRFPEFEEKEEDWTEFEYTDEQKRSLGIAT
jgi:hypothetical protein